VTRRVRIHYRRIPDRERIFDQRVVHEDAGVIITLSEPLDLDFPMTHDGSVMLEAGSLALWFTFPGRWHDIGRFHLAAGTPTGIYANILTPVQIDGDTWHTTDLFLDIWWPAGGVARLLDEEELDEAYGRDQIDSKIVSKARAEAARLLEAAAHDDWPPSVVKEWPLERALAAVTD
jgi:predicted RNA-binding protein associated with RNAse of E/G family